MAPPRKPGIAVTGMAGRTSSGVPAKRTRATIITGAPTAKAKRPNPGRICASVVTSYLHIKYIA